MGLLCNCLPYSSFFSSVQKRLQDKKIPVYENLPVGKYAVGFKIVTITDHTRVTKPEYNYWGERNEGERSRTITIHLWYPGKNNSGRRRLKYGDYCYHRLLTTTNESLGKNKINDQINNWRGAMERFFGKASDDKWNELINTPMLALEDATAMERKFPLLIGLLRPVATSITNEYLASHGYTIAMIKSEEPGDDLWAKEAMNEIPDMQFVINYLAKELKIDRNNIGAYGFSGSGFVPLLFAMHDYRIKALADLESLIYVDGFFQGFSASDYYNPVKLRIPFLHIFGRESSKTEKFISEFESKCKFSKRYRFLLNQPGLTQGDFATQGYSACVILKNRGVNQDNFRWSFEITNIYLLNFFNAGLKSDPQSRAFLSARPSISQIPSTLWDIDILNAVKPAPNSTEFEYIIRRKGIKKALAIVNNTLKNDSSGNLLQGSILNNLGYTFLNEKKYEEAIGVFKLNTEIHPDDSNLFDSLAEGYELPGDTANMKKVSGIVMEILNKKDSLSDAEKGLKGNAEKRLK